MKEGICRKCGEPGRLFGTQCYNCKLKTAPKARSSGRAKPAKAIRSRSKERAREERAYAKEAADWLAQPGQAFCCACRSVRGATGANRRPTSCVHHQRGRKGRLLRDQRFWLNVCDPCHDFIHNHPEAAREHMAELRGMPLMCEKGQWLNSVLVPDDAKALFIPLKTPFFRAFESGEKREEFRPMGPGWNEGTIWQGRPVVLSHGYNGERLTGIVESLRPAPEILETKAWRACYGDRKGVVLGIGIEITGRRQRCLDCGGEVCKCRLEGVE